jgi:hypothetical protein
MDTLPISSEAEKKRKGTRGRLREAHNCYLERDGRGREGSVEA